MVAGMGSGGLVVTDGDIGLARELAAGIARRYWERRCDLEPEILAPDAAIARGLAIPDGPVILVEAADCGGGGAAGIDPAEARFIVAKNPMNYRLAYGEIARE